MARVKTQTLRQRKDKEGNHIDAICSVCGKPMTVGERYTKVKNFYNTWEMHSSCYANAPRSRWETSEYIGTVYDIQDNFTEDYDSVESTISSLEELRDTTQDKLDNMPYSLQDGNAGQLLQERIDNLDSVIQDIEGYKDELDEINNKEYDPDEYEDEDDFESQIEDERSDVYSNISSCLSDIEI